jgi:hypothetical protein
MSKEDDIKRAWDYTQFLRDLAKQIQASDRAEYLFGDEKYRSMLKDDRDYGAEWDECSADTRIHYDDVAKRLADWLVENKNRLE